MVRAIAGRTRTVLPLAAAALALMVTAGTAAAQSSRPMARNAAYFELGGNGILYSVNYERRFTDTWTARAGFMGLSASGTDVTTGESLEVGLMLIPVMANALVGGGTHRLELGVGPLFAIAGAEFEDADVGTVDKFSGAGLAGVTSTFGYRRQPVDGGFVFRASLNPFYSDRVYVWAGLSAGFAF